MSATQKPIIASMCCFLATIVAIVLGTLARYRLPPFFMLQQDTVLSGGKQVPAEQFAHFASNFFYAGSVVAFAPGVLGILTLTEARRRYIAQLPRWKQWYIWPFHGVPSSERPTSHPPHA
jgi:hypothetical protein